MLTSRIAGVSTIVGRAPLPDGAVALEMSADETSYTFAVGAAARPSQTLGTLPARALSAEEIGKHGRNHFTGAVIGLYATGHGKPRDRPRRLRLVRVRGRSAVGPHRSGDVKGATPATSVHLVNLPNLMIPGRKPGAKVPPMKYAGLVALVLSLGSLGGCGGGGGGTTGTGGTGGTGAPAAPAPPSRSARRPAAARRRRPHVTAILRIISTAFRIPARRSRSGSPICWRR